jgi:L-serine deaminase
MKQDSSDRPLSRGEKETETEATRLIEHIEEALAAVAIRSTDDVDSLEAIAVRIERAARDLSTALRELAEQRRITQNAVEK